MARASPARCSRGCSPWATSTPAARSASSTRLLYRQVGTRALHDVNAATTKGVVRTNYANGVDASGGLVRVLGTLNQTGTLATAKGYDDVTGIGTPNGLAFLNVFAR